MCSAPAGNSPVAVGVGEGPGVTVLVGVGDGPGVAVPVAVGDGPGVAVLVGMGDGPAVTVAVGVGEGPAVAVLVAVGEALVVAVPVGVGVLLGGVVPVAVGDAVGFGGPGERCSTAPMSQAVSGAVSPFTGRMYPRWSTDRGRPFSFAHPAGSPASMAGLRGSKA